MFVPGLIWVGIVDALTTTTGKRTNMVMILRAFAFGLMSYFVWFTIYFLYFRLRWGCWPSIFVPLTRAPGLDEFRSLRPKDILFASGLALFLSIGWSHAVNRKWFLRLMQTVGVTRKFGDEGVWEYTLNMGTPAVEYVNVRDFDHDVVYSGWVKAFSEGGTARELLLEHVRLYQLSTGEFIFEMPLVYLARKPHELHIEYPYGLPRHAETVAETAPTPQPEGGDDGEEGAAD